MGIKSQQNTGSEVLDFYWLLLLNELFHELNEMNYPYYFYDIFIDGEIDVKNQNINNIQSSNLNLFFDFHWGEWKLDSELFFKFFEPLKIQKDLKKALEKKFEGIIDNNKIEIKPSKLYQLLFLKTFPKMDQNYEIYYESFSELMFSNVFRDLHKISENIYIPAKRGIPERYFKKSDFAFKTLKTYNNKRKEGESFIENLFDSTDQKKFRKSLLELFNIDGEIIIKEFENLQAVYIKKGNNEENLSDLGLGFSQLVPLILFFHNMNILDTNYTLIIEEPEANLHPELQSKLADFFASVIKTFPGLQLIVETHSEYMIRKLQYLVAKEEMMSKDCVILYFNTKQSDITKEKVNTIEILDNGMLSDHFGSGFYDEVALLQIELMNLIKQRLN